MKIIKGTLGLCFAIILAACNGGGSNSAGVGAGVSGPVTVHLSDPPTCEAPNGDFVHVWVTVTFVEAHISDSADAGDDGWVMLADLTDNPMQIDLLGDSTDCFLANLGTTTGLPVGDYQQIRVHLLGNGGGPAPVVDNCDGTGGFNCVDHVVQGLQPLLLSSQAQTGLKIPPGQITGGAIHLEAGQAADLNIDFDACASIIQQGNGSFRLKPTLHAGEIVLAQNVISGRVVDSATGNPIPGASILVYAEQPDSSGVDRRVMQTMADPTSGTFELCPLGVGNYDLVVGAKDSNGISYHATASFGVPAGSNVGDIPVIAQAGPDTAFGTIDGTVTTVNANNAGSDVELSALQPVAGQSALFITVPVFSGSIAAIETTTDVSCPVGTHCAAYLLNVPAGNPSLGTFDINGTNYSTPLGGAVVYSVSARAFVLGAGVPDCAPSSLIMGLDDASATLEVHSGAATTAGAIGFVGCD